MKAIKFKGQNVVFAENQEQYKPLPALKLEDGQVTSCWELSFKERIRLLFGGKVYLSQMTFNDPLQPVFLSTEEKDHFLLDGDS